MTNSVAPYCVRPTNSSRHSPGTTVASCQVEDLRLLSSHWGSAMTGTPLVDHGTFAIGIPISGTTNMVDPHFGKIEPNQNQARLFRLDAGTELVGSVGRSVFDLVLPYKLLQSRVRSFHGNELNCPLRFSPLLDLMSPAGRLILNLIEYLKAYVVSRQGPENNQIVSIHMQELVVSSILGHLSHNYSERASRTLDCAAPKSVRRAEEFMRIAADQPITLDVLARHAGCSERSLQSAFKKYRQKSPLTALRDIRLENAHIDLQHGNTTITDIVYKWGFTSAGRFSKIYAEKFGCKPSETLRLGAG